MARWSCVTSSRYDRGTLLYSQYIINPISLSLAQISFQDFSCLSIKLFIGYLLLIRWSLVSFTKGTNELFSPLFFLQYHCVGRSRASWLTIFHHSPFPISRCYALQPELYAVTTILLFSFSLSLDSLLLSPLILGYLFLIPPWNLSACLPSSQKHPMAPGCCYFFALLYNALGMFLSLDYYYFVFVYGFLHCSLYILRLGTTWLPCIFLCT